MKLLKTMIFGTASFLAGLYFCEQARMNQGNEQQPADSLIQVEGAEKFPKPFVVVSGAGIDPVNGRYDIAGFNVDGPFYVMKRQLDGVDTTYLISVIGPEPDRF